jgi:hypothetical protein
MYDYKNVDTTALIELLAGQTTQYTQLIAERTGNTDLCQLEYEIALIQSELNARIKPADAAISATNGVQF